MSGESSKWYDPETLIVVDRVPKASGDGDKKANLTDARKMGLLPSVTSIIGIIDCFALTKWKLDNAIKTASAFPFDGDATEEGIAQYVKMVKAKSEEYGNTAADIGKMIHKDVEVALSGGDEPEHPISRAILGHIRAWLLEHKFNEVSCETPVGSKALGWAGTPDIIATGESRKAIIDLKTRRGLKSDRESDKMQLGGYRLGVGDDVELWQCIGDRETGEVAFYQHEDEERWSQAFMGAYTAFCNIKGYDPRMA